MFCINHLLARNVYQEFIENLCKFNILKTTEVSIVSESVRETRNSSRMQSTLHVLMFIHIFVLEKVFEEFTMLRLEKEKNQGFRRVLQAGASS